MIVDSMSTVSSIARGTVSSERERRLHPDVLAPESDLRHFDDIAWAGSYAPIYAPHDYSDQTPFIPPRPGGGQSQSRSQQTLGSFRTSLEELADRTPDSIVWNNVHGGNLQWTRQ